MLLNFIVEQIEKNEIWPQLHKYLKPLLSGTFALVPTRYSTGQM